MLTERQGMKETFEMLKVNGFISKPFRTEDLIMKIEFIIVQRVLLLTEYDFIADKVTDSFGHCDFKTDIVKDRSAMEIRLKGARYKYLIAHLASIEELPIDFVSDINNLGYATETIIIYSDSNVKGLESTNLGPIDQSRIKWNKAGVNKYYDARLGSANLSDKLREWGVGP